MFHRKFRPRRLAIRDLLVTTLLCAVLVTLFRYEFPVLAFVEGWLDFLGVVFGYERPLREFFTIGDMLWWLGFALMPMACLGVIGFAVTRE